MYFQNLMDESVLSKYRLVNGILRNERVYSDFQEQTRETFGYKWERREAYENDSYLGNVGAWLREKYFGDKENKREFETGGGNFLDAGCGAGVSALELFGKGLVKVNYLGVDISAAVDIAKKRFDEAGIKGDFLQTSLTDLPFSVPVFDIIFSEGVLHHTDSTEKSFRYLVHLLRPNGRILFYVYRKKAPIREFTDDFIREALKDKSNEEAWEALRPLSKLGKVLGDLNCKVNIPEDIDFLGIKAGEMDIQRFFYYYICKAFYQDNIPLEAMNHVNFDWFRPLNCHRHTEEEIKEWCESEHLTIERMHIEPSGITTIARKS